MKRFQLISSILLWTAMTCAGQQKFKLTVDVQNIGKNGGTIRACLVKNESEYLSRCSVSQNEKVHNKKVQLIFDTLDPGLYCITLYHDQDDNCELNRSLLFGMPSEPYGFSNNVRSFFGPPSYRECVFNLTVDQTIVIKL